MFDIFDIYLLEALINGVLLGGVLALLALIPLLWIAFDRRGRKYTVTNKRVSVEFGIISKQSNEMRIQDIRSINLSNAPQTRLILGVVPGNASAFETLSVAGRMARELGSCTAGSIHAVSIRNCSR